MGIRIYERREKYDNEFEPTNDAKGGKKESKKVKIAWNICQ